MRHNKFIFGCHCLSRDVSNFSYLRHKNFDGFVISMHQSGTHWLKYMLSMAITHDKALPLPKHIAHSIVIGGVKEPPEYNIRPSIAFSHSVPSPLLSRALANKNNAYPKYIVLVRDIRNTLISHYQKWASVYNCSFEEYLSGDPHNKKYDKDIWWDIRFLNRWGGIIKKTPDQVKVIRYEDLLFDTKQYLEIITDHLQIEFDNKSRAIDFAITEATKNKMAKKDLKEKSLKVVRDEKRDWSEWYTDDLRAQFRCICNENLVYEFSYDYKTWK